MIAYDGDSQFVNIYWDQQVREEARRTQRLKRSAVRKRTLV